MIINQATNYSGELNFKVRFALHNSCYILVQGTLDSAGPRKKHRPVSLHCYSVFVFDFPERFPFSF